MQTISTNHTTIPCPVDRRVELLGEDLARAADVLDERRRVAQEAAEALGRAQSAIADAERADNQAFVDAVEAGEGDPGPKHTNAAHATLADAKRVGVGTESAAVKASQNLHEALRAADCGPLVAHLDQLAAAADERAREHLREIETETAEVWALRSLAVFLERFPEHGGALRYDAQDAGRARQTIAEQLDAMKPGAPVWR